MQRVAVALGWVCLGCAGIAPTPPTEVPSPPPVADRPPPPTPPPAPTPPPEPPNWIAEAIEEAVQWEVMPGTSGEEEPGRRDELRGFFEAHPEYEDPQKREGLADLACGMGTEGGHAWLMKPEPKTPAVVQVSSDEWRVVLAHASHWCTSDDWAWFTNEVAEEARKHGIQYAYAGATNDVMVVMHGEEQVARYPLSEEGYLFAAPGRESENTDHDLPEFVISAMDTYFGLPSRE